MDDMIFFSYIHTHTTTCTRPCIYSYTDPPDKYAHTKRADTHIHTCVHIYTRIQEYAQTHTKEGQQHTSNTPNLINRYTSLLCNFSESDIPVIRWLQKSDVQKAEKNDFLLHIFVLGSQGGLRVILSRISSDNLIEVINFSFMQSYYEHLQPFVGCVLKM
jgi:hypothetical protein